ncbi:hypothetical protein HY025_04815 [Candidatus Daviesbacteria bacterium]|nr:hypothetical protein [Candidatus Daviesbacteria bacterium]
MKKFMLLYMSPVSAEELMKGSPEEMKKSMESWMAWFKKHSVADMGMPLGMGMKVTKDGSSNVESHTTGYSIVEAEDMEAAKAMVADHPHLMTSDSSIEVLEVLPMPGM